MYNLSVLQVVDPSCFFCEILKEGDSKQYEQLFDNLNFLYSTVYRDVEELKPASLPVGALCVVFYEKMKSWCRAILESTTCSAQDELVDCFLLDYALFCPIKKSNIRFLVEECQKLPYRARKFKLHHIQPVSLYINVLESKSELKLAKCWDTAAVQYFRQLLNESLKIEAELCSVEDNCMAVCLFLTTTNSVSKICANDDLVVKKYACYESGHPEDKVENDKVTSSTQTLQKGCACMPVSGKQAKSLEIHEPSVENIPDLALWKTELAEKTAASQRETVVRSIKESYIASQNGKPSISMSEGHRPSVSGNAHDSSPQPKESVSCEDPKFKIATSSDLFLLPSWCKSDSRQILHTEAAEKMATKLSEAEIHTSKDSMSFHSQNENTPESMSKAQTCVFENVGAVSPQDQQHVFSDSPIFKVAITPESFRYHLQRNSDQAQKLHTEVAENTVGEISVKGEENPQQTGEAKLQTESDTKVESVPAQFIWPGWSDRDKTRRLSTEISRKSLAKLSSVGDNKRVLTKEADQKQSLARLLQFLSPTPLEEEPRKPPKVTKPEFAIFVSKSLVPFSSLEETSLCTAIKKRLIMCGYDGPNLTESYCWSPIAEGFDTIVISPDESNPVYYIPPLLSYLSCASVVYKLLPAKQGPHAVILCPGWSKAHSVYSLLMEMSKYMRPLNPMLLLVGVKQEDIESINFRRQCEVIVTTPHCLLRSLEHHGLLLLRLCHLVFDEVDVLFSTAGSEMSEILQIYKKTIENRDGTPQQIVAVGSKWTHEMQLLLQYMSTPRVVITRMEQAAVFANVQQVILLCLECEKMFVLLQCLDYTPVDAQKILVFTRNDEEAELVHKAIQTASVYSLLLNKHLVHTFSSVLEQWKKSFSCRTILVLVVTDDYAPLLEIRDATCIIHYSFPENVGVLSLRLFSLMDYIQSRIDKLSIEDDHYSRARSVLLMTNKHASYAIDLLKSLQQAQATVPPELSALAQGLLQAWENKKQDQELCTYLKTFGYCSQDRFACPHRHCINPSKDLHSGVAAVPENNQYITVLPLRVVDAARFFGRIVIKNDPYDKLAAELNEYYQSPMNKVLAQEVVCKHLYAVTDGSEYHRVQVLATKIKDSVSYAHVQYIDNGKLDEIPLHMLFLLPPMFQSFPPLFREFIVCRVRPIDNEDRWDPKVTRIISRSITGKQHKAKVVLYLGNTYWLDPMVQVTTLSDLSSCVYDLNVRQEILSSGLGTDNPQHILYLKALLESSEYSQSSVNREERENIEVPEKSVEDSNISAPLCLENTNSGSGNKVVSANLLPHSEEREQLEEISASDDAKSSRTLPTTSLYPVVKWFEKDDTVILTVKLQQVTDSKCTFYSNRLVFSCCAGGKHYVADMELYKDIVSDKSKCIVKNGEAVITIQKCKAEMWNKLLKCKHPNVSFDLDHLEDSEDSDGFKSGLSFSDKFYNVVSEDMVSSEYSESESD
ncbi:putative ATP-dependent RNA helicase TDRD12 [Leptodactylus fuscus]|uniref:putative ATP-dependent RNA helicase TDRD12 n=1 Tax=Leptodactylus fuscus TaxID=238119 RepID=UPI003F4EA058